MVKHLADLTVEDLVTSPVWRYEGGSGGDALVVPAKRKSLSQKDDEIFLAATDFRLFDSSEHVGFCFPADDSGIDYLQPAILSRSGHVNFWFDGPVAPEVLESQWRALGKELGEIFPVAFRCLVLVDGRTVSGQIASVEPPQPMTAPTESRDSAAKSSQPADFILTARPIEARRKGVGTIDTRTARRRQAEMTVEFTQDSLQGTGVTGDVSRRGLFVRSTQIPGTGPMVRLTVNLPDERKLVLTGKVVRSHAPTSPSAPSSGFGLRLADDWPDYEELLSRLRKKPQ